MKSVFYLAYDFKGYFVLINHRVGIINKSHKADSPLVVITGGPLYVDNADRLLWPRSRHAASLFNFRIPDIKRADSFQSSFSFILYVCRLSFIRMLCEKPPSGLDE